MIFAQKFIELEAKVKYLRVRLRFCPLKKCLKNQKSAPLGIYTETRAVVDSNIQGAI